MVANLTAIATATCPPNRLSFTRAAEFVRDAKPVSYAIKNILEQDAVATLIAAPGVGKSFLAIDWACCIATGTPWHGHKVNQGAVLLIAGEGHSGLSNRLLGWERAHDVSLDSAPLYISNRAVALNARDGYKALCEAINEVPETPVLIVVDTLARNFEGDENSSKDMGAFITTIDDIRRLTNATVLIVHHSGWGAAERGRGSSALFGGIDREWLAKREDDVIRLTCLKAKDAELPPALGLRLESVLLGVFDEDGEEKTTAVLRECGLSRSKSKGFGANQAQALDALRKLDAQKRSSLTQEGRDPDEASVSLADWKKAAGLDRKRFPEARRGLEACGAVTCDETRVRISSDLSVRAVGPSARPNP